MFPLGTSVKPEVRVEAQRRGLAVAQKPDSHDICFVPDGDTAGFLARQLGRRGGDIVDPSGRKVGEHAGTHAFTIGQRRGLRLGVPAADGQPRYVLDISPVTNTVTVGPRDALAVRSITGVRPTWTDVRADAHWSGAVQLRAHGSALPATVSIDDQLEVVLESPVGGVAPGQAVVLYDGTRVVGSATIAATAA
jgi:tRNA-specific 2-thiouridylase